MGKGKDTRLLKLFCVENVHIRTLKKSMNSFGFIWLYIILSFTGASDVEYLSKTNNLKWKKTITMRKPIKIVFYFSTKMKTNTVKTQKYYIGLLAATTCNAKNVVYWQSNPSANLFLCLFLLINNNIQVRPFLDNQTVTKFTHASYTDIWSRSTLNSSFCNL